MSMIGDRYGQELYDLKIIEMIEDHRREDAMTDNVKERAEELRIKKYMMQLSFLENRKEPLSASELLTTISTPEFEVMLRTIRDLLTELEIATSSLAMHKTIKKESQAQVEALRVREGELVGATKAYLKAGDSWGTEHREYKELRGKLNQALATTSSEGE